MDSGVLGGGLLLVVLVLLWLVVLIPAWARSRQHRAVERHAAQIQRTLRMLAETAELPEEHVVEATAKEAFEHQKMLKRVRQREARERKLQRETERASERLTAAEHQRELAMHKAQLRRTRLSNPRLKPVRVLAALASVTGLLGILVGAGMAIGGLGFTALTVSLTLLGLGGVTLVALAPGARTQPETQPRAKTVVREPQIFVDPFEAVAEPDTSHEEYEAQQAEAAAVRERARAMARARMQQHKTPEAPRVNQPDSMLLREAHPTLDVAEKSKQLAAKERLSAMGVVGDTSEGATSLEEALRRRRNAG